MNHRSQSVRHRLYRRATGVSPLRARDEAERVRRRKVAALSLILGFLSCAPGCARKTEDAKEPADAPRPADPKEPKDAQRPAETKAPTGSIAERFDVFVAERNACTSDSECVLVSPGCPLDCGVGVRAEKVAEVEAKAQALLAEQEKETGRCTYKCAALHPKCQAGRCAAVTE